MKKRFLRALFVAGVLMIALTGVVFAETIYVSSIEDLQSAHPYTGNEETTWVYTHPTPTAGLNVTFSEETELARFDNIDLYDGTDKWIENYYTTELAGQTISVYGNVIKVKLTGGSSTKYGFSVSKIETRFADNEIVASGDCGSNVKWKLYGNGKLVISGSGAMASYTRTTQSQAPWYSKRAAVQTVEIGDKVTTVGSHAFYECSNLQSVTLPETITKIGTGAFDRCSSLVSLNIPDSVTAFGDYAFYNCSSLTSIHIPEGITKLSYQLFQGCDGLTSIDIPDSVTFIDRYAFYGCDNLASVVIPEDVTVIYSNTFENCTNLATVTLPDGLTEIQYAAFRHCDALTSITIPASVTTIGTNALLNYNLTSAEFLGDAPTSFETNAFNSSNFTIYYHEGTEGWTTPEWNGFTTVCLTDPAKTEVASGVCGDDLTWKLMGDGKFIITGTGPMYDYDEEDIPWLEHKDSVKEISFPDGMTRVGYAAFYDHDALTSITLPDSVTAVRGAAFSSCAQLETVDLGDGCGLGDEAFLYCPVKNLELGNSGAFGTQVFTSSYLTSLTITADAPQFAEAAFFNCKGLTEVHFKGSAPALVTDQGWVYASFLDKVTWYYDCGQSNWLTSDRYDSESSTWAGYAMVSENHVYSEKTVPPTCTEQGYTANVCPCGNSYPEPDTYVPAINHRNQYAGEAKAATCTEAGNTDGMYCPDCETWTVKQEEIPATGHTYEVSKFLWAEDLISADAALVCHCAYETEKACTLSWDTGTEGKLTVTATVQLDEERSASNSKEITVTSDGETVTVTLPHPISGMKAFAATYDGNQQMTAVTVPQIDGNRVILPAGEGEICLFLLNGSCRPICPMLRV